VLVPVFREKDGIFLVDYLEKGATIMAKYSVALLNKLKQQLFPAIPYFKLNKQDYVPNLFTLLSNEYETY
jgi:hypothetical protein